MSEYPKLIKCPITGVLVPVYSLMDEQSTRSFHKMMARVFYGGLILIGVGFVSGIGLLILMRVAA